MNCSPLSSCIAYKSEMLLCHEQNSSMADGKCSTTLAIVSQPGVGVAVAAKLRRFVRACEWWRERAERVSRVEFRFFRSPCFYSSHNRNAVHVMGQPSSSVTHSRTDTIHGIRMCMKPFLVVLGSFLAFQAERRQRQCFWQPRSGKLPRVESR
jgi:hypothetical protein